MSLLNEDHIKDIKEKFNLRYFIETGSYLGEGIQSAINVGFKEENIFSCDILERFVVRLNKNYPKAKIVHDNSVNFLKYINSLNLENCLFWLDAHFASQYGGEETAEDRMPVLQELKVLTEKTNIEKDYIMCDDMRVIQDSENVTCDSSLHENVKVHNIKIKDMMLFDETHHTQLATNGDGILIFTPK